MKQKLLSFFLVCIMLIGAVYGQERTIRGKVTGENGEALPGVSVLVSGTTSGTTTDADGNFSISVPSGTGKLEFRYIGYQPQTAVIGGSNVVNVTLSSQNTELTEVVVTAQGIERDIRSLGYSTQQVSGQSITQRSEPNVLNSLQGKVAGVNITSSSGQPGSSTNINIRGITSFTGSNQPLIVVDGIIFSNDTDNSQNTLFGSQPSNRLNDIPADNIESINVLKGPAAAALYGSRASAGAIMITTKSGKGMQGKTEVTFNSSANFQKAAYLPPLQNEYGQGTQNNYVNNSTNSWGPKFGTPGFETVTQGGTGLTVPYQAYPNNIKDFYKTGSFYQNSLNLAGGDEITNFTAGLSSTLQNGIVRNSGFDRHTVNLGGNTTLKNGVKIGGSMNYVKTSQQGATMGNGGSAFGQITRIPRSYDLINTPTMNEAGEPIYFANGVTHPLWSLDNEFFNSNVDRIYGNLNIGYDITDWLNVTYRITADTYTDRRKQVLRIGSSRAPQGQIDEDLRYRSELNGDLLITAKKKDIFTEGLNANVLLGQNINQRDYKESGVVSESFVIPGFDNVSNGSVFNQSYENNTRRRLLGHYAQLSLDYKSYLFLELTGRADKSSTLPEGNNTYFYPSASMSFVPTDAWDFESSVLSYAKVRAAVARVGRDADPYLLNTFFIPGTYGNNTASITYPINIDGSSIPGFISSRRIGSNALKPEFVTSYEFGANLGLWNNRIGIDFTYFNTKSTNQIFDVGISNSSGFDNRTTNVGEMVNKGIEVMLNGSPVKNSNFSWDMMLNFTRIRNNVVSIAEGVESSTIPGNAFIGISPSIAKGYPYGVIIGTANVRNEAGELLINGNTGLFVPGAPNTVIANPQKDFTLGFTNTFTYKGISLMALVDWNKGGQLYSFSQVDMRTGGQIEMTGVDRDQPRILPGVIANGDGTYRPNDIQISAQSYWQGLGGLASEGAVFDATAFRLREVSLTYSLPQRLLERTPFGQASIGVSGRNLFLFAPGFPGDPEINTQGAGNIQGMDLNGIPTTRNYGINLRVTF
jgi:TonB-linked SusC/RagA family outer membrane protein